MPPFIRADRPSPVGAVSTIPRPALPCMLTALQRAPAISLRCQLRDTVSGRLTTNLHWSAVWDKPERMQMASIFGDVAKLCAPGERPMINPHAQAMLDALPEITSAAGFSDVVLRCRPWNIDPVASVLSTQASHAWSGLVFHTPQFHGTVLRSQVTTPSALRGRNHTSSLQCRGH